MAIHTMKIKRIIIVTMAYLKEEFRFDDLSKDIHVIEYNYSSDNLLRCKYIYNLHNEDKLEGILLYEYK